MLVTPPPVLSAPTSAQPAIFSISIFSTSILCCCVALNNAAQLSPLKGPLDRLSPYSSSGFGINFDRALVACSCVTPSRSTANTVLAPAMVPKISCD